MLCGRGFLLTIHGLEARATRNIRCGFDEGIGLRIFLNLRSSAKSAVNNLAVVFLRWEGFVLMIRWEID